ncbi:MAG: redoxin domain-containing protein [Myxococcaceae bacterium]|nr:redoxin domain-containing protein [Myxococcaceae bacterium]
MSKTAWALFAVLGVALGAMWLVFHKSFGNDPHAVPFELAGKPAPRFTMKRLDTGELVKLEDFIGRPIVLNFWATWCGPCKEEHPVLQWAYQKWQRDVVFLGVVFEDTEENTKAFLVQNGSSWPQLYDPKSTVAVDFGVAGVPETYFINRSGVIVGKYPYPIDPQTMTKRISEILQ